MKQFPKYFCVWFGPLNPVVSLVHPDTIKVLLKTAGIVYLYANHINSIVFGKYNLFYTLHRFRLSHTDRH